MTYNIEMRERIFLDHIKHIKARMAELSLRDERTEIGNLREPLLFHVMRGWTAPWGVVPGMPYGEEASRQAQDTLVGLHFSSCSGTPVCYPIV